MPETKQKEGTRRLYAPPTHVGGSRNLVNLALTVQPVCVKDSLVSLKLRLADRLPRDWTTLVWRGNFRSLFQVLETHGDFINSTIFSKLGYY